MKKFMTIAFTANILFSAILPVATARAVDAPASLAPPSETIVEAPLTPAVPLTMVPMTFAFMTPAAVARVTFHQSRALAMEVPCSGGFCLATDRLLHTGDGALPLLSLLAREIAAKGLHAVTMIMILLAGIASTVLMRKRNYFAQPLATVVLRV